MLKLLKLQNFRCFRDVTVDLAPLTAFVGPNASGKTSLLRAAANDDLQGDRDVWRHEHKTQCRIEWLDDGRAPKMRTLLSNAVSGHGRRGGLYLHLDTRSMRSAIPVQEATRLESDGANLANVFATFARRTQEEVAQSLASLVPVINDVTLRPSGTGSHRLVFEDHWQPGLWYEPNDVSDGALLVLALLVIQHLPAPVDLVAIEEPDHGLHPYLLANVVDLLRRLTKGETGPRPVQILLATQSAELLEHLEPSEVRFLNRNADDGSVEVEAAETESENWRRAFEAHQESLGSLWMSGSAGGVPS